LEFNRRKNEEYFQQIVLMRILITTGIFPPDIGGPATFIEQLASDLSKADFEVAVLTYGSPEKKSRLFRLSGVSKKWPNGLRQFIFGCKTFYLAEKADIIYAMDLYSVGYLSMLAAKFWRKKFISRFAGDSAWETAFNRGLIKDDIIIFQEKKYNSFIERLKERRAKILKSSDVVIVVSNFMKKLAEKIGAASDKIFVIYNAIDFFGNVPGWEEPDKPILVFSGRLTSWKGVSVLLRVVIQLKNKYPDICFKIIGNGPEEANLKNLAKELNLGKSVDFIGKISESETHKIFSHSEIFVLNTNYEGLSHAILNAMNVGIPVITASVGGNLEVVQNEYNGLLVPYNDEKAWFFAIDQLLSDKSLREKFSQNGKKTLEKFKWSDLLQKTIAVFNNLCKK